ncbi:hypothetical protein C7N83_04190 [Neisseria iguanae]|uniref:Uncharacterized protein n=1 Tax=Neisseria iguanae TaxID=90242 RepID=A0A2P7U1B3_9NEIS|nr:hypothetical protein C7N83_04190 [Neisseria iguanae]
MLQKSNFTVLKKQQSIYSDKKKCHPAKAQITATDKVGVLYIGCTVRQMYDFTLFKLCDVICLQPVLFGQTAVIKA